MCNAETMLLAQASRAAVALTDVSFDRVHVIGEIAVGAAFVALALLAVIAVADYISHGFM